MEQELLDQIQQHSMGGNVSRAFNTLKELFEYDEDAAKNGMANIVASFMTWFDEVSVDGGEIVIINDGLEITLNVTSVKII